MIKVKGREEIVLRRRTGWKPGMKLDNHDLRILGLKPVKNSDRVVIDDQPTTSP